MAEATQILLPESFQGGRGDFTEQIWLIWELIKAPLIVPVLRLMVYISLAMSLMLFFERLYMGVVIILVKLFWKKPEKRYKYEPIQDDLELGSSNFPHVLIQIPMFNEREVGFSSILPPLFSVWIVHFSISSEICECLFHFCCRFTRSPLELLVDFHGRPTASSFKFSTIQPTQSLRYSKSRLRILNSNFLRCGFFRFLILFFSYSSNSSRFLIS